MSTASAGDVRIGRGSIYKREKKIVFILFYSPSWSYSYSSSIIYYYHFFFEMRMNNVKGRLNNHDCRRSQL